MRMIGPNRQPQQNEIDLTMPSFIDMVDEFPRAANVLPRKPKLKESKRRQLGVPEQTFFGDDPSGMSQGMEQIFRQMAQRQF